MPDQNRKRKPLSLMSSLTLQGLPRLVKKFNVDFRSSLRVIDPPVDGALRYITTYMVLREQGSVMKVRVMLNLFGAVPFSSTMNYADQQSAGVMMATTGRAASLKPKSRKYG